MRIIGLGYTAQSKRTLKDGRAYDKFFVRTKPKTDPIINQAADTFDTVKHIKSIVLDTLPQTKKLSDFLMQKANGNVAKFLQLVWQFQYDHIGYKLDHNDFEQLREPVRTWEDKLADCDCYALFTSSILTNQGIEHSFRIVKMNGKTYYQHIYVVVPSSNFNPNNPKTYTTIDPVVDNHNYEPPGITFKTDIAMTIPVQRLNGLGNTPNYTQPCIHGTEFSGYGSLQGLGLGSTCSDQDKVTALKNDFIKRVKVFFENTKIAVQKNPNLLPGRSTQFINDVNSLLSVWNDEIARTNALDILSKSWSNEADNLEAVRQIGMALRLKEGRIKKVKGGPYIRQRRKFTAMPSGVINSSVIEGEIAMIPNAQAMGDISGQDMGSIFVNNLSGSSSYDVQFAGFVEDDNFTMQGFEDDSEDHYVIEGLNGLGRKVKISVKPKNVFKAAKNAVKSVQKVASKAQDKVKDAAAATRAAAIKVQDKAKNTALVKAAAQAQNKAKEATKNAAKKIVEVGKKAGKAIVKYSPVGVAARNGLLIWFKLNIGRNAEKAIMGYATREQALKAGLTEAQWQQAKNQLAKIEKIFVQRLKGDKNILRKNIFASKKAQKIKNTYGLSGGLGEPVSASALMAVAAPLIASIAALLSSLKRPQLVDSPSDIEDPNLLPPVDVPNDSNPNESFNPYQPSGGGVLPSNRNIPTPPIVNEAEQSSDRQYQDTIPGAIVDSDIAPVAKDEDNTEKSSNTGLIVGGVAALVGIVALVIGGKSARNSSSLRGTDDLGCDCNGNPIGNTNDVVNTDDVTELSGLGNSSTKKTRKTISLSI